MDGYERNSEYYNLEGFMKRLEVTNAECFVQSIEGLSDEQVEQFREAFTFMDKDSDGFISVKELGTILRVLGQNPTESEIQDMINVVDRDSNGVLDFSEFASLMVKYHGEEQEENELWMAFKVFDREGTGLISATELKYALTNLGNALTEDEVDYMFEHGQAILDKDGRLNYTEFLGHFLKARQGAPLLALATGDDKNLPDSTTDNASPYSPPARSSKQTESQKASSKKSASKTVSDSMATKLSNSNPSAKGSSSAAQKPQNSTPKATNSVPKSSSSSSAPKSPPPNPSPKSSFVRTSSKKRFSFKRKSSKNANGPSS